mmetsp:Transcript_2332/g.9336  ORF Transcript_2332/g.9336 Transcript_2332/m.9336 type:complete len:117 (+) Transcript_2332:882-1232(+)
MAIHALELGRSKREAAAVGLRGASRSLPLLVAHAALIETRRCPSVDYHKPTKCEKIAWDCNTIDASSKGTRAVLVSAKDAAGSTHYACARARMHTRSVQTRLAHRQLQAMHRHVRP